MTEKDLEKLLEKIGARVKPGLAFRIRMYFALKKAAKEFGLAHGGRPFFVMRLALKPVLVTLGILIFVLSGTGAYAYTNPEVTEGTVLYPLKRMIEQTEGLLARTEGTKAEYHLKMALRRREESKTLERRGMADTAEARSTRRSAIRAIQEVKKSVNRITDETAREEVVVRLQEQLKTNLSRPEETSGTSSDKKSFSDEETSDQSDPEQKKSRIPEGSTNEDKNDDEKLMPEKGEPRPSGTKSAVPAEPRQGGAIPAEPLEPVEKTIERTLKLLELRPVLPPPTPEPSPRR